MRNEREAQIKVLADILGVKHGKYLMRDSLEHIVDAMQAARQSAGANETTLRVLSSHAIRKHEGVTIFGDPAQVLKVMAAIESAGATGQEAVAWMHKQGDFLEPSLRQLDSGELSRGWTQEPLFYAAPIGDNGASGYVQYSDELTPRTLGEKAAFLEGIEEGRMRAVRDAQPAESTRVELTDEEIDAVWDSVSWKDLNVSSLEHVSILRRRFARALLARASAKGA